MNLLYIDLFCGAGGTSTGVESARVDGKQCAKVIACVNHDKNAIASHAANHPDALHFTEDIRTLRLSPLVEHTARMRRQYPEAHLVLWASLECTNFSKAKGGKPRDADSRTLAEHLFRYIEALNPDYIQIENVEEFMSWGDMDENGKPISRDKGKSYVRWCNRVRRYGYGYEYRILNSADFGAYTSRKRFFGCFVRQGLPMAWPTPTHSKNGIENGLFGSVPAWRPVREVLDFSNKGQSIFDRKKPLSEGTLERIYEGLVKFVAGGKDSFLSKQFSGHPASKNTSLEEPAGTITTIDHHAFVSVQYGNGYNRSVNEPASTLTDKDRLGLTQIQFLDMQYGNGMASSLQKPAPTVTAKPKHNLVSCTFLMNPQYSSAGSSVDKPCFTLIAGMDKMPPYLVQTEAGDMKILIEETDSPMTKKIKEFMMLYNIVNIHMRMLTVLELKQIMGFPENYLLCGTQAEQKKYIGNAVEVHMARALCEALSGRLSEAEPGAIAI